VDLPAGLSDAQRRELDVRRGEVRYRRERRDLYRARLYGGRAESPARLEELDHLVGHAEVRLRDFELALKGSETTKERIKMSKPNRYEVAKVIGEIPSATTTAVAEKLGVESDHAGLEKAFESGTKHGLIEKQDPTSDGGSATFAITEKGKRKVAANA
jgi:hypothetical protein